VFAHLLDHDDFKLIAPQAKDQSVKPCQIYRVLAATITFKRMAAQSGQTHQFVDALGILNDVDPLDVSPCHRLAKRLARFAMLQIASS